jgi:prepilin-type processing-associated H-X9-DG protein
MFAVMNKTESATAITCMAVIGSLSLVSAGMVRSGGNGSIASQDADKLRNLHQAMLQFACDDPTGALPTPGRINRWTDRYRGSAPGVGPENQMKNSSSNLYSALVAQQFITTADLISPAEVSDVVREYDGTDANGEPTGTGYEYDEYDPAEDIYWVGDVADPDVISPGQAPSLSINERFQVQINRPVQAGGAHVSYAHLQLCGKRKLRNWRVDAGAEKPILSNRGPRNGATSGEEYTQSPTLLFYQPNDAWNGNVLFADGHVIFTGSMQPAGVIYECEIGVDGPLPDNIFAADFDECFESDEHQGGDTWLCLNKFVSSYEDGFQKAYCTVGLYDALLD